MDVRSDWLTVQAYVFARGEMIAFCCCFVLCTAATCCVAAAKTALFWVGPQLCALRFHFELLESSVLAQEDY